MKIGSFQVFVTAVLALLLTYSIALVSVEYLHGQECVRGYFSDISTGKDFPLPYRPLFGINTTITVSMLIGIVLLFLVTLVTTESAGRPQRRPGFAWSQIFFFLYIACDERLLIHEKMGVPSNSGCADSCRAGWT